MPPNANASSPLGISLRDSGFGGGGTQGWWGDLLVFVLELVELPVEAALREKLLRGGNHLQTPRNGCA